MGDGIGPTLTKVTNSLENIKAVVTWATGHLNGRRVSTKPPEGASTVETMQPCMSVPKIETTESKKSSLNNGRPVIGAHRPNSSSSSKATAAFSKIVGYLKSQGQAQPYHCKAETLEKGGFTPFQAHRISSALNEAMDKLPKGVNYQDVTVAGFKAHLFRDPKDPKNIQFIVEPGKALGTGAAKAVVIGVDSGGKKVAFAVSEYDEEEASMASPESDQEKAIADHGPLKESGLFVEVNRLTRIKDKMEGGKIRDLIVMPLAEKGTLDGFLREASLSREEAVNLILDGARGLATMHAAGIVHGDIKPGNALVKEGKDREPKMIISDFGTCTRQSEINQESYEKGTIQFFPPESEAVLERGPTFDDSVKKDWFAYGMVALSILNPELPPLAGMKAEDKTKWIQENKPQNLVEGTPEAFVWKMLDPDPQKRVDNQTAGGMIESIQKSRQEVKQMSLPANFTLKQANQYVQTLAKSSSFTEMDKDKARESLVEIVSKVSEFAKMETSGGEISSEDRQELEELRKWVDDNQDFILINKLLNESEIIEVLK
jgi:serine/threonine protein kinase